MSRLRSVTESAEAIETLARRIQALPDEIRWAHTDQDMILATAKGVPIVPGPQTARLSWFLGWAAKVGLDIVAGKLVSLVLLAAIRCRQTGLSVTSGQRRFFVGISALREHELVPKFEAVSGGPVIVIDQRFSGALAAIYKPKAAELLRSWLDAAQPIFADLVSANGVGVLDRSAVLNFVVRRLHHYAHFLAVFRGLNASVPGAVVAFSTAGLPAYAAVQAGIDAIYFPHGFLSLSLVFPDFHRVIAFNAPEAAHVQDRLPRAVVSMPPPLIRPIQVTRRVAVVGDYGEKLARSRGVIEFCRAAGIDVVVRPHPADHSGYWTAWEDVSGVRIDRAGTFDEFLERYRPCIIVTWYSTTVYDALVRGVVAVSLEAEQPDIVFPLAEAALRWPADKEQIQTILANAEARYDALTKALNRAIGPTHAYSVMQKVKELDSDFESWKDAIIIGKQT